MARLATRWLVLGAALVGEGLLLTISFESPAASARDSWAVRLASVAPDLIHIGGAAIGALAVLLSPRLRATLELARQCTAGQAWRLWLVLHAVSFAALYGLLETAGPGSGSAAAPPVGNTLGYCEILSLAWLGLWLRAVAPFRFWRIFTLAEYRAIVAAIAAGAIAWLGGEASQAFWRPLASATFSLAERLLRLVYPDVVADPSQLLLGTPNFLVRIAPQCSGYEGIGLVTVFLALYLWLFRSRIRFPQAFLLFPVAALVAWLANIVRIAALVALGSSYSPVVAAGGFHSQAGWIAFIAVAAAVIAATHRMKIFCASPRAVAGAHASPMATAMLVPFLVLMGSAIVTRAASEGFDWLYPLRVVAAAAALLWFVRTYATWDWSWSWASLGIGAAAFVAWIALDEGGVGAGAVLSGDLARLSHGEAGIWIAFRAAGSVFLIPLVEELAFRGYLLRRLATANLAAAEANRFRWMPFLVSSAAFGLLHGRWVAGTVAGMAYAAALYRRGRLGDAVAAHMTTNGLIALLVLIGGYWSLWS